MTIENTTSAHDVAAAYCLAMAEVRVRLPLGALEFRTWGSLASRVFRKHEIAGSNPAVLTDVIRCGLTVRQLPVKEMSEGSIPSTGAIENGRASRLATAAASKAVEHFEMP